MTVKNRLLAVVLTAGALASAASAAGAAAAHLGLPSAHVRHGHEGHMFAHREAGRYQQYGYDDYGGYAYGPYAAQDVAQPLYGQPTEAPVAPAAVTTYNGNKVCPVVWRWSDRAGQAVRSWSYCNN
jgi:hypothetical protein